VSSAVATGMMITVVDRAAGFEASFEVFPGETILEAAIRADIDIPYSCRSGTCRTCLSKVESGEITHDPAYADELLIEEEEDAAGYRLLCSSLAYSDSVVDIG
jgi:ferredoxin